MSAPDRPAGWAGTPVTGAELTQRYQASVMNTFGTPARVLARGEGSTVWDVHTQMGFDGFRADGKTPA